MKTKTNASQNVLLLATPSDNRSLFELHIIAANGAIEYLLSHRWNKTLFNILKNGITLAELKRKQPALISNIGLHSRRVSSHKHHRGPGRKYSEQIKNSLDQIMRVAEDYIEYELCA